MRIRYRLWQVWQAVAGQPLTDLAWQEIASHLSPSELTLFQRYGTADRRHAYRVLRTIQSAGNSEPPLLSAALLHDIGKTKLRTPLWARSLAVMGEKLVPDRAAQWAEDEPEGWRVAFLIKSRHAEWGAEMATAAGSAPLTVALIRRHQEPPPASPQSIEDELLLLLQWADNQS